MNAMLASNTQHNCNFASNTATLYVQLCNRKAFNFNRQVAFDKVVIAKLDIQVCGFKARLQHFMA